MYDRTRYYVRSVRLFLAENNDPCDAAHPFFFPSVVSAKKIQQEKEKKSYKIFLIFNHQQRWEKAKGGGGGGGVCIFWHNGNSCRL